MNPYLPDVARFDSISIGIFFVAVACLAVAMVWLAVLFVIAVVKGWHRLRWPLGLLLIGLVVGAIPLAWTGLRAQIDLGPLDRQVDGERHLTLTGWDRPASDYDAALASRRDAVVLQMANPDVTDEVVAGIDGMDTLRELDLNDSAVTDEALATIAARPALEALRMARTQITDEGFREHLANKESIDNLDVRGTAVSPETLAAWVAAKPGRRVLPRPPAPAPPDPSPEGDAVAGGDPSQDDRPDTESEPSPP
ncbi:hypothetical protein [Tautonia marina]|uniref:hypothetical protein n=1 Tax=Tautonia marina TaxID=2653855 RepID=UPI001260FB51|nr:hypothetical protein [Tautonia marina]